MDDPLARRSGPAPPGDATSCSSASKGGCQVIGHVDDYCALKQQILEGKTMVHQMASLLRPALTMPSLEPRGTEVILPGHREGPGCSEPSVEKGRIRGNAGRALHNAARSPGQGASVSGCSLQLSWGTLALGDTGDGWKGSWGSVPTCVHERPSPARWTQLGAPRQGIYC